MIIALQQGLYDLESRLRQEGFKVVSGDYKKHADFYLYYETMHFDNNFSEDTALNPSNVFNGTDRQTIPSFINVRGKSYDMILNEIYKKRYDDIISEML